MPLKIGGIPFDGDPQTDWLDPSFYNTNSVNKAKSRIAYTWNCESQKETSPLRLDANGKLTIPNLVEFHVSSMGGSGKADPTATLLMKAKTLRKLSLRKVEDLVIVSHRAFGKHKIKVDTSGFDWLKPIASYTLWLEINFQFFKFSNAKNKLEFFIGLPHSADLRLKVDAFCRIDQVEPNLESGNSVDPINLGLLEGGREGSRELRRRYLRERIEQLNLSIRTAMLGRDALVKERDRYIAELEALE